MDKVEVKDLRRETWADRYVLLDKLGHGTYGSVLKAYDLIGKEHVAIKTMETRGISPDDEQILADSMFNELEKLKAVRDSPVTFGKNRIVNFKRRFFRNGRPCLVLECLGETLRDYIHRHDGRKVPLEKVATVGRQLMEGLAFLSRACLDFGITHADIKPENVLMTRGKGLEVKIADFGLSFMSGLEVKDVVQSLPYRAPEVMLGLPIHSSIDVWSVGVVLVEMVTGEKIFDGRTDFEVMTRMVKILGVPPVQMLARSPNCRRFFGLGSTLSRFDFNDASVVPRKYPLEYLLWYVLRRESNREAEELFAAMLQMSPANRIRPSEALRRPFLQTARDFLDC